MDKRTKLTDLWHDLFRVNKCTFATYIFTTFKKLYTIYTETFDKLLYSEYLQCKIIFLNCSATKHDPITQKYHHYCFLDPWKFASYKSTHLGWNIIFKLQSKQYNNHLHYVWIMHYITYEHECQNSEKKKKQGIFTRTKWSMNKIAKHWKHGNK